MAYKKAADAEKKVKLLEKEKTDLVAKVQS